MRTRLSWLATTLLAATVAALFLAATPASADTRTVASGGTAAFRGAASGTNELQFPEIRRRVGAHGTPLTQLPRGKKRGKFPQNALPTPTVASSGVAAANPELGVSFNGLTARDQRLANGGNQFTVEPPDQALCAANGFVLESVNTVIRVRNTSGGNLTGVQDLNTFYGYPAQFNRTPGHPAPFGPFLTDPVCLWVPAINRWVHLVLTLDQIAGGPLAGSFLGTNHLDLAVSNTSNPTGSWTIYRIPAQNDGSDGTPDNGCPDPGPVPGATNARAELGDYPHLGMDANGIYISTNGYCLFSNQFNGAQLYAIGLQQLSGVSLPSLITFVHFPNTRVDGSPGFTVWPATSFPGEHSTENGGTEYLLSTIAGDGTETGNPTGSAKRVGLWAITNTSSLNTGSPNVSLTSRLVNSQTYTFPPLSDQKQDPTLTPLRSCINDTTLPTPFGPGCWQLFFLEEPAHDEVISTPDSLDGRMQQVWYVNGSLWGAAGTGANVGGEEKAGIAWFNVEPKINGAGKVEGKIKKEGYLALASNNLTMPALAMLPSGKGAIAFSVLGEDFFPSAGYVTIDEAGNVSPVHIVAAGLGPDDGFTSYKAFVGDPPRTRWGDYGAAWTDGSDIWIASEYIGQKCTFAEYVAGFTLNCGATRVSLANWYTRISKLTP